ncbi:MAG: ATP synthase F1 subunit delta [Sorangiineae bacterium]|nr:ATP synthase F1 subunit delta [Polyangiaceae bacterium]MEB2322596.1 ATP synthase F1 subunit delta [Sorangiineae bacterium]
MKPSSVVAERYARAIFELAIEQNQLKPITEQIGAIAEVYGASRDLRAVLDNPLVTEDKREALLVELGKRLGLGETALNALRLIARRRRLGSLAMIAARLGTLADERAGIVRATVSSAAPLSEAFYQKLAAELERATSRKIVLQKEVDPSLIAGVVTRIGDNTIDGSVKGRLATLERQLLSA